MKVECFQVTALCLQVRPEELYSHFIVAGTLPSCGPEGGTLSSRAERVPAVGQDGPSHSVSGVRLLLLVSAKTRKADHQ